MVLENFIRCRKYHTHTEHLVIYFTALEKKKGHQSSARAVVKAHSTEFYKSLHKNQTPLF